MKKISAQVIKYLNESLKVLLIGGVLLLVKHAFAPLLGVLTSTLRRPLCVSVVH